jgi:hypothetical protein
MASCHLQVSLRSYRGSRSFRLAVNAEAPHAAGERYARAAAKYCTGSRTQSLYVRPNLNQDLNDFKLTDLVTSFSTAAASNPVLYVMKLDQERQKQREESKDVDWSEIL